MESKDLILIICAIIVGACIIAGAIYFTSGLSDNKDNATASNATENVTNSTNVENITSKDSQSSSNSSSKSGVYIVSEVVKYNAQADDGSYYREITYSDGGFRQYNVSNGKLIGSSYASDQKYLPSME